LFPVRNSLPIFRAELEKNMKKLHAVLLLLGVAFLAWLVRKIGARELWHELTSLGWGLIPFILFEGVAELIHTVGWRHCLSWPHQSMSLIFLFRIRMAGYAINYVTPTAALGGEVTRAALLASNHRGPEAVSGVLIGKLCFAFGHLLFVALGSIVILWRIQLPRALWEAMLVSSALVAGGMLAFLLLQKYGKLGAMIRWLAARKIGGHVLQKAAGAITEVDEALKVFYRERPLDLALAVCWHLLGFSVGIVQTWLFFHLLNQHASLAVVAGTWFLGMWFDLLTFAVPMNLGALEGSRIVALKAVGYNALLGMTYGVALRLALLFWTGFGLVNYAQLASKAGAPSSRKPVESHPKNCTDYRRSR
jgi:uncharacterized protein (TIRG00374 family)